MVPIVFKNNYSTGRLAYYPKLTPVHRIFQLGFQKCQKIFAINSKKSEKDKFYKD